MCPNRVQNLPKRYTKTVSTFTNRWRIKNLGRCCTVPTRYIYFSAQKCLLGQSIPLTKQDWAARKSFLAGDVLFDFEVELQTRNRNRKCEKETFIGDPGNKICFKNLLHVLKVGPSLCILLLFNFSLFCRSRGHKFFFTVFTLCWNKALWLAVPSHVIAFNQFEDLIAALHS